MLGSEGGELLAELLAGVGGGDFGEPGLFRSLIFVGKNLDDVEVVELFVKVANFAVDLHADDVAADFAVEAIGEVEGEGTLGEVDDVALWGIDENLVGEEVQFQLVEIDLFAFAEAGSGGLELGNPEEVSGEVLDFAFFIILREFLFVVIERGGETVFGEIVHLASADLELDNLFVGGDDGGVEGLVAVLFRNANIVLDPAGHGGVEGMDEAEDEIAGGDVGDDDTEGVEVVDFGDVLAVFGEFAVEGIDGFDAARKLEGDFFFFEQGADFGFDFLESFFARLVGAGDEVGEVGVAFGVNVGEGEIGELDAEATHVETLGKGGEDFESFFRYLFLAVRREGGKGAEVVEAVGEFDDEDADVGAEGDHEAEEVVTSGGEVGVDVAHIGAGDGEFGHAINEEGDGLAKFAFNVVESDGGIFDGVVEDASDNGVFVHVPRFEDFHDGERVVDEGLARGAELAGVSGGGEGDGTGATRGGNIRHM